MMKKPDEFQEETELTTETKVKITATLERLKEDGLDLYGCDYVDVKDLAYIYHAAHYLMRYVEGMQATIEGMDIAQVDFCRRIKQLEAERDAALADFKLYRERNIKGECGVYACDLCKRGGRYEDWDEIKCPTGCTGVSHWQWRGAQKEE